LVHDVGAAQSAERKVARPHLHRHVDSDASGLCCAVRHIAVQLIRGILCAWSVLGCVDGCMIGSTVPQRHAVRSHTATRRARHRPAERRVAPKRHKRWVCGDQQRIAASARVMVARVALREEAAADRASESVSSSTRLEALAVVTAARLDPAAVSARSRDARRVSRQRIPSVAADEATAAPAATLGAHGVPSAVAQPAAPRRVCRCALACHPCEAAYCCHERTWERLAAGLHHGRC
jgi:hypothetical protein